jgi:hypothetical protein
MARQTTESSFDELTRGLASGGISRGRALRLMGAALVGGTLTSFGIGGVAAADECKPTAKKCKKNKQCCSGNCSGGKCAACPPGQVLCSNGSCVSNSCPTGQTFNSSTCQCECPSGQVLCSNGSCGLPNGGTCTADTQCCSGTICANGECCTPNFSSQTNPGACTADSECCSGICNPPEGTLTTGFCFFCRALRGSCAAGEECCRGECRGGTCCGTGTTRCDTDADCCTGRCLDPVNGSSLRFCEGL